MDRDQLRALQAPLKQRYREDPESALITLRADGFLRERVACSVSTGAALVEAGLHPATGGTGLEACSGDMLLQALVACAGVTLTAVATALGVRLRSGRVIAEGDPRCSWHAGDRERCYGRLQTDQASHRPGHGRNSGRTSAAYGMD